MYFFLTHSCSVINGNFCGETEKCVWAMSWRRFKGLCELIDFSVCLVPIIDLVMFLTSFFFFPSTHASTYSLTHTNTFYVSLNRRHKGKSPFFLGIKHKAGMRLKVARNRIVLPGCLCLQVFLFTNRSPRLLLSHQYTGCQG